MQLDDYRAIKQRAARRLLRVPGVNAVGLGGRVVGGRPTGDVAIKVFVTRKKPASEVPPDELVPASIEGVPTDVVELGRVRRAAGVPGVTHPGGKPADFKEYSPLRGGISVATEGKQGIATLGCLLVDPNDSSAVYALTNHHVVTVDGKLSRSRQVAHPSTTAFIFDEAFSIGIVAAAVDDGIRDAAIVRLATGGAWLPFIEEIGWVRGTHDVTLDETRTEQYQVRKRGMKTGLTGGVVVGYDVETDVEGSITKGNLIIRPNADPADPEELTFFSFEGDSGSVVVNEADEVVGLFYATDHDETAGTIGQGIVTPIAAVLRAFKDRDHLDLQIAVPKNANPTEQNEVRSVEAPAGSPHIGGPEEIARGDHAQYRPLTGGAQILAAPMLGPVNSTTLGCMVTEVADSQKAYVLTSYAGLSASGNIPPTSNTDIGQPDNEGRSSGCCRNTVGAFFKGGPPDQTPTAGLVALKGDLTWVPEILEIGVVAGVRTLAANEVEGQDLRVLKRGAGSGLTGGVVIAVGGVAGTLPSGVAADAMLIRPNPNLAKPGEPIYFTTFNDRGAVVVDDRNRVLGVVYDEVDVPDAQGHHVFHGVATPIAIVLDQLRTHAGVEVEIATAAAIDDVRTTSAREAAADRLAADAIATPPFEEHLVPAGLPASWHGHQQEIRALIDRNRRVAAVWRRAGGPALVQAFLRALRAPSDTLPVAVNGVPMAACLQRIGAVLTKYGSAALGADLAKLRAQVPHVGGLSLDEILDAIRAGAADA